MPWCRSPSRDTVRTWQGSSGSWKGWASERHGPTGEPGRRREKVKPAAEIVAEMADAILGDLDAPSGSNVLAFVNGLGGTPTIELYVIYNELAKQLAERGLTATRSLVGDYITSLEMAGASITLLKLDDELTALWDAPVHTPALRWGR